jgi:tripartite-type tricarboxylate transporter receptor subunit TctC
MIIWSHLLDIRQFEVTIFLHSTVPGAIETARPRKAATGRAGVLLLALAGAMNAGAAQQGVAGAAFPSKPIRLISPFVPGGGASIVARLLSEPLTAAWGQSVIVDNRGGAAGTIGTEMAARAAPDGYTLVMATASTVVVNPLLSKVPFDPIRDFAPVVRTTTVPLVLVVPVAIPAKSVKELIALAASRAGGVSYASSGEGSISHLAAELFKSATGVAMAHVPYKGGGQALIDLIAGHVQTGFVNILEAMPQMRSGRLRGLAVTSAARWPVIPDIPTVAESGVAGYAVIQWSGVLAPAGTPHAIVAKLNAEILRILNRADMRERLIESGAEPGGGTPEEFGAFIKAEIAKWSAVVKSAQLRSKP